ncbi:DUF3131 domain-containing protein [Desulfoluna sp.]|uniref:DUF3131 domain-containing protein n=1 Tax=Desulfoluna sp. TaxID=2045199 RepID=UPI00260EFD9E|nr:DUF3131 domain-containing protein [Desulfoluna sp.]
MTPHPRHPWIPKQWRWIPLLFLCLFLLRPALSPGTTEAPWDFTLYRQGLAHFNEQKWIDAAENWMATGDRLLKKSRNKASLRKAGLAHIFATIAFEKADNAMAYTSWSTAVRYFLEGQTSWEAERTALRLYTEQVNARLKAGVTGTLPFSGKNKEQRVLEMEETLHLSRYDSPVQGLKIPEVKPVEPQINVSRQYFPRPPALTDQVADMPVEERASRHGTESPPAPIPPPETAIPRRHIQPPLPPPAEGTAALPSQAETGTLVEAPLPPPDAPSTQGRVANRIRPTPPGPVIRGAARGQAGPLTDEEQAIARTAWGYFNENYQTNTGMINGSHDYPYATLWDLGSTLAGYVAALKLNLIPPQEGQAKIIRLLETFQVMELYNDELPNRQYNTQTGEMTDLKSRPTHHGSGWSALDIGRLLIWLKITEAWFPDLKEPVERVIQRWTFDRLVMYRELNNALYNGQTEVIRQEGRLGYEQYAAMGFTLLDHDVRQALDYAETQKMTLLGLDMLFDTRDRAFLTSDPFVMAKMEIGAINNTFSSLTEAFYGIQKQHWLTSGEITAVNEDAFDKEPWFVYNSLFYNGIPWVCLAHDEKPVPELATVSTKAAMAWSVLYDDAYATALRHHVIGLRHPKDGFYAGVYPDGEVNPAKNINTNAVILEAMLYLKRNRVPFLLSPD